MWISKTSRTIATRRSTGRRCRPSCDILEGRSLLTTFNAADVAGLQSAMLAVNSDPSKQATIVLAPGTYDLTSELMIVNVSHLTIKGDSTGPVIIDNPTHSDRIFEIDGFGVGDVTIDGLVISGGYSNLNGGGIDAFDTSLTVEHCTIEGNSASYQGGGVSAEHCTLTVKDSTVSGNSAQVGGGGIYAYSDTTPDTTLIVKDSTISGNSTVFVGGGIDTGGGAATVDRSTISGNSAGTGGGINAGTLIVRGSAISGNSATTGGGIYATGAVTVKKSTISDNTAASGGGIYALGITVEITNSTLNDPLGGGIFNNGSTIHLKNTVVDGVLYVDG